MILAWDNKWDAATLVTGSELASLPGANVQHPHLSRKWYTGTGVKSSHQVADMGSSLTCAILGVFGTNLTAAATYRVRASDVDPNAVATLLLDTGTLAAGVKAGYGAIYKTFNQTTARYWRVDLTDNSVSDNLRIGRIFVGPYWSHAKSLLFGWGMTPIDDSPVEESAGGQAYPDPLPKRRQIDFALDYLTETEAYDNPFAMARAAGAVKDVLVIPRETGAFISEQSVWGLLKNQRPVVHRLATAFRQQFTVKESL